jgi:hypothetical protein
VRPLIADTFRARESGIGQTVKTETRQICEYLVRLREDEDACEPGFAYAASRVTDASIVGGRLSVCSTTQ